MASTYTPNKNLNKPARGDKPGIWDEPVNYDWDYIDDAFGGYVLFSATAGGSHTLTSGKDDPYSYIPLVIEIAGVQNANLTYIIPSSVGGQWIVKNSATDGAGGPYTTTFTTDYPFGPTSVVVEKDTSTHIYTNAGRVYSVNAASATSNYQNVNKIINGNMLVDQRGAGTTPVSASGVKYTVDRWYCLASTAGKMTVQKVTSNTSGSSTIGFPAYLYVVPTATFTPGATDTYGIGQVIEGLNIADLGWGYPNAQSVTLSFWVKVQDAGTYGGAIINGSNTYSYPFSYYVTGGWNYVQLTIPGPTTGAWSIDNSSGMNIYFSVGTGGTYSGTAGAWAAGARFSATGAYSIFTTSHIFGLTGVQLEVGTSATPYQNQIYSDQLAQCQRYLPAFNTELTTDTLTPATGFCISTTQAVLQFPFEVAARIPPTNISVTNVGNLFLYDGGSPIALTALTISTTGPLSCQMIATVGSAALATYRPVVLFSSGAATQILFTGCELG